MSPRPRRRALVAVLLLLMAPAARAAALPVAPGSIVRWPGAGIERCGEGESAWKPLAGVCYYPIDLLRESGPLTVWRRLGGARQETALQVTDYPYPVQEITLEDTSKVDLSAKDLARVEREQARVAKLWRRPPGAATFTLPLASPLEPLPEGGRFGSRRVFNGQPRSPHTGSDYAAPEGAPVRAAAAGEVVLASDLFFSGNSVFIDHGDGLVTMYFHLSRMKVAEGQRVERGQVVGEVGHTGRATGPHLHLGARWRGARIEPGLLLAAPEALPTPPAP